MCGCVFVRPNEINIQRRTKDTPTTEYKSILLRGERRHTIQIETCVKWRAYAVMFAVLQVTTFCCMDNAYTWGQCLVAATVFSIRIYANWYTMFAVIVVPTVSIRCFHDGRRYEIFPCLRHGMLAISLPMYSMTFFIRTKEKQLRYVICVYWRKRAQSHRKRFIAKETEKN